uniref:DDE Tnp4 domain-containing protein n=1 Tax=Salarias fasciatus TaxID=181472 RepID=A0A672FU35_SALFA
MHSASRRKVLAAAILFAQQEDDNESDRGRRRRHWIHPINQQRWEQGNFHNLVAELALDKQRHHIYFRKSAEQMDHLLSIVGPELTRQTTNYRAPIEPEQRLAVAVRFLASGDSLINLAFCYRLGHSTVAQSVHMVCAAIEKLMMAEFLPTPTQETWTEVARGFWNRWNFPNCLGALDGKKINIQAPANSGSQYFDYKRNFSIVLMALVDADYRFRAIQVGDFGRMSDGGVFVASDLGRGMESGALDVPPNAPLPGAPELGPLPHVMVGDAAFPLKTYLLRPYPGTDLTHDRRIFNYRLSRARMVVECAFGILTARWRVMLRDINLHPNHVDSLVVAACILHNFLLSPRDNVRMLDEAEGAGGCLAQARNLGGHRAVGEVYHNRNTFTTYCNSPAGCVSWQEQMI